MASISFCAQPPTQPALLMARGRHALHLPADVGHAHGQQAPPQTAACVTGAAVRLLGQVSAGPLKLLASIPGLAGDACARKGVLGCSQQPG